MLTGTEQSSQWEQIARDHMGHATTLAWKHCTTAEDIDEIRADALLGLARAINSWDPDRGESFRNWAYRKMLCAIMDGRRDRDHLSRDHRRKLKGVDSALNELAPISLDVPISGTDLEREILRVETIPDPYDFIADVITRDLYARIQGPLGRLPSRERFVLAMFCAGHTLADIGGALGISESRACQVKTRALRRIRDELGLNDTPDQD